ncbi:MAG: tautomerase family protein [Gammaproteobacteria bacterium]|nr:tautomerase family protein [Gammaproteobacteria bacterium]
MPIVQITIIEGRAEESVQRCIQDVARTVSRSLECPIETIRVVVNEVPPTRFAVGDKLKGNKRADPRPFG